jgi:hypothetical protein
MLALLGSLLGFATSAMPDIFAFFQDKRDKGHELEMMTKQAQIEKERAVELAHINKDLINSQGERDYDIDILAAVNAQSKELNKRDRVTGDKFLDRLRGSVRPVITYWWMLLYSGVKVALIIHVFQQENLDILDAVNKVWTENDIAVFASIIAFWFGHKMMDKRRADIQRSLESNN